MNMNLVAIAGVPSQGMSGKIIGFDGCGCNAANGLGATADERGTVGRFFDDVLHPEESSQEACIAKLGDDSAHKTCTDAALVSAKRTQMITVLVGGAAVLGGAYWFFKKRRA
jgi:LPXTG-motif cell wall-anchored protein